MTVNASDELKIRQAAALLNEQLARYKTNFNIIEKQDLFAIVAFDAVFEKLSQQEQQEKLTESVSFEIDSLMQQMAS